MKHLAPVALGALLAAACTLQPGSAPASAAEGATTAAPASAAEGSTTAAPASAAATSTAAAPASLAAAPPPAGNPGDIKWAGPVEWRSWDEALAEAQQTGRSIGLVVYADWCPRCKELAPVFTRPDVVELAEKLVMVRQDADDAPPWLARYADLGGYVPRIFFLKPDGTVREDLHSGHPRYPYFYTPGGVERLKESMRRAAGG